MTDNNKKVKFLMGIIFCVALVIFFTIIVPFTLHQEEKGEKNNIEQNIIDILIEKQYFIYDYKMYKIELVDELEKPEIEEEE